MCLLICWYVPVLGRDRSLGKIFFPNYKLQITRQSQLGRRLLWSRDNYEDDDDNYENDDNDGGNENDDGHDHPTSRGR